MSVTELLIVLGKRRQLFLLLVGVGFLTSVSVPFFVPKYFTSNSLILVGAQPQGGAASALAQLGAMTGSIGVAGAAKTSDELYVALFKSRTVLEAVVEKNKLIQAYGVETVETAAKELAERVTISSDRKSGLITVSVDDQSAVVAANVANSFLPEMTRLLAKLAVTSAQQKRLFFERQVASVQEKLDLAEVGLRRLQEEKGLVLTGLLVEERLSSAANIRSQLIAQEVKYASLKNSVTAGNPMLKAISAEVLALKSKLAELEDGNGRSQKMIQSPALIAMRDVKVHQLTLDALLKQLEVARLDEAKETVELQQVEMARPAKIALKPRRILLVIFGVVFSTVAAAIISILVHFFSILANGENFLEVKRAWNLRRDH